jgi:hypothetical protein
MPKDIRRIAKQLQKREKFHKENPLFFLTLNKPQTKFMDAVCETRSDNLPRRIVFIAANKVGKTTMGVLRGICLAIGEHPFLPDDHPLRKVPNWETPNVGLVCGEQLSQSVDKKLVPEYLHWIPKICEPEVKRNPQGVIVKITLNKDLQGRPLGSVIHFRSWDMTVDSFEGIDMHWIHWDEPPRYPHFVAAERGLLPTDGISFMTFTSLKEPWIKDFADASIDYGGDDPSTRVVEGGNIWENSIEKGGFLTAAAIEEFVKIVPKEEYPARVMGQWLRSGSIIYSSFKDEKPYVVPNFEIPRHWTRMESVDPHDAKSTKWLFAAISPHDISIDGDVVNRIFIVDYLNLAPDNTIVSMVDEVRRKRADLGYSDRSLYSIILDAKYGRAKTMSMTGEEPPNWQARLEEAGAGYIELSYSKHGAIELGHKIVKAYLKKQYYRIYEKEIPGIVFLERCRGLEGPIESMLKYRYKVGSDTPEDDYKDWADTVRYLCLARPVYIDRSGFKARRETFRPRDEQVGR